MLIPRRRISTDLASCIPRHPEWNMETSEKLTGEQLEIIAKCEQRLGYEFRDKKFLFEALTHASGTG